MSDASNPTSEKAVASPAPTITPKKEKTVERYPAMQFMIRFASLLSAVMAVFFVLSAVISIFTGLFSEDVSIIWGLVNAGMTLLIGCVLIAFAKGMGEVFQILLTLEARK